VINLSFGPQADRAEKGQEAWLWEFCDTTYKSKSVKAQ
jgi:hypothetical protein